jgi:hypothetical protein
MAINVILVELDNPNNRIKAQWLPNDFSYNRDAKLESVAVVGRSNDIPLYHGGNSGLNVTFDFVAVKFFEMLGMARTQAKSKEEGQQMVQEVKSYIENTVVKPTKYIESLAFGQRIKLIFGEFYQNEVWKIAKVDVLYSEFAGIAFGHLPIKASAKVSLVLDPKQSILPIDLRN